MQLEHSFTVPVGIDDAWRILLDIEQIGPCMPGATIESVDGDDFTGSVKVKLGPINLTYKGKATFLEKDEGAHKAVIDARGRDARGNGTAAAKVTANLAQEGDQTAVQVVTDLDITGKPAQFGRGVMVDVGNKLIGQFASCLADKLSAGAAPAATEPAGHETAAQQTAAQESAPPAETPGPTEAAAPVATPAESASSAPTEPAAAAPAAAAPAATAPSPAAVSSAPSVTSANGRPAATPTPEAEPIDLLQSAGPAVAKRLAPLVAAVLAAVAVFVVVRRRS